MKNKKIIFSAFILGICLVNKIGYCQSSVEQFTGSAEQLANANSLSVNSSSFITCFWDTDWSDACLDEINWCSGCEFFIDEGKLMYGDPDNACSAREIYCVALCPIYEYEWQNVIAANASTYSNQISMDETVKANYDVDGRENTVETGEAGKWYLQSAYSYKTELTSNDLSFESGVFEDFSPFNWPDSSQLSSHWLLANTNTAFTPDGHLLEAENVLGIKSAEKFGYNNNLVYLAANNASFASVLFESFEKNYSIFKCGELYCFEEIGFTDAAELTNEYAHSGDYSLEIKMNGSAVNPDGVNPIHYTLYQGYLELGPADVMDDDILNSGLLVKIWLRYTGSSALSIELEDYVPTELQVFGGQNPLFDNLTFESVARTGEWELYEAKIKPEDWKEWVSTSDDYRLRIAFQTTKIITGDSPLIYVDDVRVQPLNAQMAAYVFDPSDYKMITEFDDQHFGMYYQYNDEGKLIRTIKETVRGMKTLSETQYHIPETTRE
jgi:hypothetical protein